MKNKYFLLILIAVLIFGCNNSGIKEQLIVNNDSITGSFNVYDSNGILTNNTFWMFNDLKRINRNSFIMDSASYKQSVKFASNGELREINQQIKQGKIGYSCLYYKGYLYQIKQNVIVKGVSMVNQFYNFDFTGNLDKSKSNFYSLTLSPSDTVYLDSILTLNIELTAPYFKIGYMDVVIGNFDPDYNLISDEGLDTIKGIDFKVKYEKKFKKTGEFFIRGKIINYGYESGKSAKVIKKREHFFEVEVLVI